MIDNCCCFTGHRIISESDLPSIKTTVKREVIKLISNGVDTFFCGGAIGFDTLCGKVILELKADFPGIKLHLALPCPQQDKYYNIVQHKDYELLKNNCDQIFYASPNYHNGCMHERNRFMVEMSKYVICFCRKNTGGTFYTVKYATKKNKSVISI